MASDPNARARVIERLEQGSIVDAEGRAVAILREAVSYRGNDVAFSQLLAAMARSGQLDRDVRGRRTYRIALAPERGEVQVSFRRPDGAIHNDALDYERLAASLLRHFVNGLAPYIGGVDTELMARLRVQELEARVRELERVLREPKG